jgi:hypothetical protein
MNYIVELILFFGVAAIVKQAMKSLMPACGSMAIAIKILYPKIFHR